MPDSNVRPLSTIAAEIRKEWGAKVNYAAKPYLDAMATLNTMNDKYYADDAQYIVRYFLANAQSFRGDAAKRIKAELKAMAGIK